MSKSSSKPNISVGSALSLASEVTKALSPVIRDLSQEQIDKLRKNPLQLQEVFRQLINGNEAPICLKDYDDATDFFLDNVVDRFGDKHRDVKIDLSRFAFKVITKEVDDSFAYALEIRAYLIESVKRGERTLSDRPVWSVEFEELVGMLSPENSLVQTDLLDYHGGRYLRSRITEEFIARNGILKFRHKIDDLFVSLEIDEIDFYREAPLSYKDARLFEI